MQAIWEKTVAWILFAVAHGLPRNVIFSIA